MSELTRKAEELTGRAISVTVPIYTGESSSKPQVLGSGVLFSLGDTRFLVTAGHVLDHLGTKAQLVAGVSPDLLSLAGLPTRLQSIGASTGAADRIDIGIVRLQGDAWERLDLAHFVEWPELDISAPTVAHHAYALVGFPCSINRRAVDGHRVSAAACRLGGLECAQDAYQSVGIDPMNHVMVDFDKNAMLDARGPRVAPDLYGASGGGLWRFGRRIRDASAYPKLSAIATEWHRRGRHKYILGTRIQVVIEALADRYSDVGEFVAGRLAQ